MINTMDELLDVMTAAALRQAAYVERTANDPVARPLDMRQCIFAGLFAALAEGAEMAPSVATEEMVDAAWTAVLAVREDKGEPYLVVAEVAVRGALTANPLRIRDTP